MKKKTLSQTSSSFFANKFPKSLPEINIFKDDIFSVLQLHRGFVISASHHTKGIIDRLFLAYHHFLMQPQEEKQRYQGNPGKPLGFYETNVECGNIIGPRFYIQRSDDKEVSQPMPEGQNVLSLKNLNDAIFPYLETIIIRILSAICDGMTLTPEQRNAILKFESITSLHHQTPVSQEKLQNWLAAGQLSKTADDRIETMRTHKDLSLISLLIYRNNYANGLEIKMLDESGNKIYRSIKLDTSSSNDVKIVVMLGRIIETFASPLKGLSHRVTALPFKSRGATFSRDVLNCFVFPNHGAKLIDPSKNVTGAIPFLVNDFCNKWLTIYENRRKQHVVTEMMPQELNNYVSENEIECQFNEDGISYRIL